MDRSTGRLIEFWVEGVLPHDNPLEGMQQWNIFYRVEGGEPQQIFHEGAEFGPRHPLPASRPVRTWPCWRRRLAFRSRPAIPSWFRRSSLPWARRTDLQSYRWLYLHGRARASRAREERPTDLARVRSVEADPPRVTRGMDEPTIDPLERRAADPGPARLERPESRAACLSLGLCSKDGGQHWTRPEPWTYDDGDAVLLAERLFPAVRHSNGKLYWVGHITAGTRAAIVRATPAALLSESITKRLETFRHSLIQIYDPTARRRCRV